MYVKYPAQICLSNHFDSIGFNHWLTDIGVFFVQIWGGFETETPPTWPLLKPLHRLVEWKPLNVGFVDWISSERMSFIYQLERAIGRWVDGRNLHNLPAINCGIPLQER